MDFESDEILVTNGGSEALLFTFMAICDPGDNIFALAIIYTSAATENINPRFSG